MIFMKTNLHKILIKKLFSMQQLNAVHFILYNNNLGAFTKKKLINKNN